MNLEPEVGGLYSYSFHNGTSRIYLLLEVISDTSIKLLCLDTNTVLRLVAFPEEFKRIV